VSLVTRPDRIVWTTPVNKQAALQTSGVKDVPVTPMQERRNLQRAFKALNEAYIRADDPREKRRIGKQIEFVQREISKRGRWTPQGKHEFANWIVNVAKDKLPRPIFDEILREAGVRYHDAQRGRAAVMEEKRHRSMIERVKATEL